MQFHGFNHSLMKVKDVQNYFSENISNMFPYLKMLKEVGLKNSNETYYRVSDVKMNCSLIKWLEMDTKVTTYVIHESEINFN